MVWARLNQAQDNKAMPDMLHAVHGTFGFNNYINLMVLFYLCYITGVGCV